VGAGQRLQASPSSFEQTGVLGMIGGRICAIKSIEKNRSFLCILILNFDSFSILKYS
jgi:hypothetical protein